MRHRTRTRTRIGQSLLALTVVSLIVVAAAGVPAAPAAPAGGGAERAAVLKADAPSLPDVLERVRAAAGEEAWRRGGWTDPVIDTWIEQTLAALAQARPELDLPAPGKLATYAPRDPGEIRPGPVAAGGGAKALVVAKQVNIVHATNAVILVDGDAEVSFANNCVVIARGVIDVAHGSGNIIASGQFISVSHDGSERRIAAMMARDGRPAAARRQVTPVSLLLTPGTIDIAHAMETVCAAGTRVDISNATGCTFINSPDVRAGGAGGGPPWAPPAPANVELKLDKVRLGEPPQPHPLAADLRLHAIAGEQTIVFWHKTRRYVADKGWPIVDENAAPVPALAGWVLSLASDDLAVLSNDEQRATIVLRKAR